MILHSPKPKQVPTYNYKCDKCHLVQEKKRSSANRNKPLSCNCKGKLVKTITTPNTIIKDSKKEHYRKEKIKLNNQLLADNHTPLDNYYKPNGNKI